MPFLRQACFKVKREDDVQKMMDAYSSLSKTNERVSKRHEARTCSYRTPDRSFYWEQNGKPYLLAVEPHATIADSRNQGYNFVATTQYASMDDIEYYDTDCEAHKQLKSTVRDLVEGPPLTLIMKT